MTSIFILISCLSLRILLGYLTESYGFLFLLEQALNTTIIVLDILCIAAAVWAGAMLIWQIIKQATKIKGVSVPIGNKPKETKHSGYDGYGSYSDYELPENWDDYGGYR